MATKRIRKTKEPAKTDQLLKALRFVALAQSNDGTVMQRHCVLNSGWIAATDNVMTLGAKVPDDLTACPQTKRLIAALERAGDGVTITHKDADRLSVVSGGLRVSVPCVPLSDMAISWADPVAGPMDDRFLDGLRAIGHIASETAQTVQTGSILCTGGCISATNREVLAEYWHGLDTPPYWVLPAATVDALLKIDGKKLTGLGFSGRSATFHFDDESWLKTQLFEDKWFTPEKVWNESDPALAEAVPETFFDALNTLNSFTDSGFVSLKDGLIVNSNKLVDAAEIEVPGLKASAGMKIRNGLLFKKIAKTMQPFTGGRAMFFYGDNVRMALAIATVRDEAPTATAAEDYGRPVPY